MNINVATDNSGWTDFEKKEWAIVDAEHYGKPVVWTKKYFHLIAEKEGETVGSLRLEVSSGVAYVDAIIVGHDTVGKGVGKALMEKAEEIAREQQSHKIFLNTGKDWEAPKFYEKLGYKKSADLPNHYFHVDFIEMTKFLPTNS